uniref:Uncharacterized protein n=1 Tax=Anas platyrhynchos TaxID=8839 RepID=A0A8B9SVY2_ANAPL
MYRALLNCTGLYWAVLGHTRLYSRPYWGILGCTELCWAGLVCAGAYWSVLAHPLSLQLLVPLVVLGAVAGAQRCPPRCLCPAAAPSPTLLCARTGLLAVPPSLDRGAVELRLADNFIGAVGRADFANMSSLVHLTLSRNGLRRLAPGAFADLRALRALHLDGNRLPALSGAQLRGLASLRHLILANNQLAAIEPAAFAAFAATVEDLDLSHNNLPALPWEAVAARPRRRPAGLPRLARLDLTANRRGALPPVPGPPGPSLAAGGNPLHCNCELLWLRRLARPDGLESCASPPPLAGRLLWAVPEEELRAEPPPSPGAAPLRLGCAAAGDPPPALHWLGPDGRLVQNGSRRALGADGSLQLRVATLRDPAPSPAWLPHAAGEAPPACRWPCCHCPCPGGTGEGRGRGAAPRHVPGFRMVQIQYNTPSTTPSAQHRCCSPSSRSFVLRDLAAGREYDLCVSALYAEGSGPRRPPPSAPWGCVRFCHGRGEPRLRRPPRPHFLGGTVIIVIGAAIAASVLVFILTPPATRPPAACPPPTSPASARRPTAPTEPPSRNRRPRRCPRRRPPQHLRYWHPWVLPGVRGGFFPATATRGAPGLGGTAPCPASTRPTPSPPCARPSAAPTGCWRAPSKRGGG